MLNQLKTINRTKLKNPCEKSNIDENQKCEPIRKWNESDRAEYICKLKLFGNF